MVFDKKNQGQKGVVLLMVLMVFALAAMVSSELSFRTFREVYRTSNIIQSNESYMLARGGEAFAIQKLIADFKFDEATGLKADYLEEAWAIDTAPLAADARTESSSELETGEFVSSDFLKGEEEKEKAEQLDIGHLTIIIEDLQARFNVNNVLFEQTGLVSGSEQLFALLDTVKANGVQTPQYASSLSANGNLSNGLEATNTSTNIQKPIINDDLIRALRDWVDNNKDSALSTGGEDEYYTQKEQPYLPANRYIRDISELRAIKGFNNEQVYPLLIPDLLEEAKEESEGLDTEDGTNEEESSGFFNLNTVNSTALTEIPSADVIWGGVKHYFSALPFDTTINVNTASAAVLSTLFTTNDAQIIVDKRLSSPYQKVDDIFANLPNIKNEDKGKYASFLSVNSHYFLVTSIANIDETRFTLRSKIHRREDGEVRVISRDFSY